MHKINQLMPNVHAQKTVEILFQNQPEMTCFIANNIHKLNEEKIKLISHSRETLISVCGIHLLIDHARCKSNLI